MKRLPVTGSCQLLELIDPYVPDATAEKPAAIVEVESFVGAKAETAIAASNAARWMVVLMVVSALFVGGC
jgi:hypothetical protein